MALHRANENKLKRIHRAMVVTVSPAAFEEAGPESYDESQGQVALGEALKVAFGVAKP